MQTEVVKSEPDTVQYQQGHRIYEEVLYDIRTWTKGEAWSHLAQRYAHRFDKNPWRKDHGITHWRWYRQITSVKELATITCVALREDPRRG